MANYRNPNGYGSVVKLSGKRRKPFVVRKTVGWDDRAYPIYATIGYYETRKEAVFALAEYNHNPFNINLSKLTFAQLYEKWAETELPKLGRSLAAAHRAAYRHCSEIYDIPYKDLRKFHMQKCIDECGKTHATQRNIKNLFSTLDKYAYDQDIIRKCYSANLTVCAENPPKERILFSDSEVMVLHQHIGEPFVDETLFMLYSGCRVSEMLAMECANIDLARGIMKGGLKTKAGKDRIIPIHSKLMPIVKAHLSDGKFLFDHPRSTRSADPEKAVKDTFLFGWQKAMTSLGLKHNTHDCRHTFRTKLDGYDKVAVDLIMGHSSSDVGERVYTHKTIEQLKTTIENLSYFV